MIAETLIKNSIKFIKTKDINPPEKELTSKVIYFIYDNKILQTSHVFQNLKFTF